MVEKREIIIWTSTFVTYLVILYSVAIAVMMVNVGAGTIVHPYILGDIIGVLVGNLAIEYYLLITLIASFILLGVTCLIVFRRQPLNPELVRMLVTIEENIVALRKTQEGTLTELISQLEYHQKANRSFFKEVNAKIEDANKEMIDTLGSQGNSIKKARRDLIAHIESKANETKERLSADFKEQEKVVAGVEQSTQKSIRALRKQQEELEEIKVGLEKLEEKVVPIQAKLKSLDNVEEIKGIGPHLGEELSGLGITSVHEFLTTDPKNIGEKTRLSPETAENLQTMAQLLMVPGITETDAEMLIDAGVKSRKELSDQDLIQLSSKVSGIAKVYVDQGKITKDESPTIEEISSWIRMAK